MRGLAIRRNLVTCAQNGCVHPGETLVAHRSPAIEYELADGRQRTHEGAVVELEYCEHHAGLIEAERAADVRPAPAIADWGLTP